MEMHLEKTEFLHCISLKVRSIQQFIIMSLIMML